MKIMLFNKLFVTKKPLEEMTGNSSRKEAECTTKQTNVQSSYKKPLKTFKLFLL
jgi:hypothetical protein